MSRWLKVTLVLLAALTVLLVLNAIAVSNETEDAEVTVEGAELVDTSSGTLQVLEEGDQPIRPPQAPPPDSPIVLIHGYGGSLRWFDELAELLAQDHRVVRLDLLGHGGSDKPGAGYGMEDQANAVAEALASLEVTGATVVGHSLGATVATALAEQSPELAAKVVDLDQAPDDSHENGLGFTAELVYVPVIGQAISRGLDVAPTSLVRDQFQVAFAPDFNIASGFENPDQVVDDVEAMTYTAFVDTADGESEYSDSRPLDERLAALGIPVLVIFGSEDQLYDAESALEPYDDVAGARTELIDGVGHSPNVEVPERIAPLISAFASTPPPGEEAEGAKKKRSGKRKREGEKKAGGGEKGG